MTRKARLIGIAIAAVIAISAVLLMVRRPSSANTTGVGQAATKSNIAVELVQPDVVSWPMSIAANGALMPWQEATISAETGGLGIVALHADVGTRVKKGQLLAELNSVTVRADLRKAEANVASAKGSLREKEAIVRRAHMVKESGALSEQQIEQYEIAQENAAATLASAEADLASARIKLAQTRILAVDNGVISSRTATLGAVVSGGTELFRLVRDERVEWRAQVDASQLAQLKTGQSAKVSLPTGSTVEGTIRQLSPTLNSDTRTAIAYVDLPGQDIARAGMYASGRIELGQQPAMKLPSSAITLRDGRSIVFEVDPKTGIVTQRQIVTGRIQGDLTEVVSGVKSGTSVVRSGGAFLNDGDTVRINNAKEST